MAEINLDDVEPAQHDVVILHTVQPHHALMKANRTLLRLVFCLLCLVFVLGFLLLPRQNFLEQYSRNRAVELSYATQSPALSAQIDTLKGQMFSLVSGSIDSKLKSLEENIRRGSLNESLETLQALKSEVKVLTAYSPQPAANAEQAAVEQNVYKELSELKSLVYLTAVSCGLMLAALAGVWLRRRYLIGYQKKAYLGRKH